MKKVKLLIVAVAALLSFVALTSCSKSSSASGLSGTVWSYSTSEIVESFSFTSAHEVTYKCDYKSYSGTYLYVEPTVSITFTFDEGTSVKFTGKISGNVLTVYTSDGEVFGEYTKN